MFNLCVFICLLLVSLYISLEYLNFYWKRRNIAFVKPIPLLGNLLDLLLLRVSFGELFQQLYENPAIQNANIAGIFILHRPAMIVRDPDLIKLVLIKNFDMFLNRYEAADYKHDLMGALCLPLSKYPIWRGSRKKMAEVFTTGRMKERMYPLMLAIAADLEYYIQMKFENLENSKQAIDIEVKEMCSLFTTDLTSILHYGVDAKGLKNGHSSLRQQTCELFSAGFGKVLNFFIIFFLPHLTGFLRAKVFTQSYTDFMRTFTKDIFEKRKLLGTPAHTQGDLLDVLHKFQQETSYHNSYAKHQDFIPSQVAIFLLAGFETSSSVISFILYELAKQPKLQRRLRLELREAFQDQQFLAYEKLQELQVLHQVVCEGLRMYPAAAFINRECTSWGENSKGFYLKPNIFVPKGMPIYISILGLHRDPKHWPDPNNFMPERFSTQSLKNIHPMTYLPFGAGPHACIGSRLGLLQVKLGLAHILKVCRVEECSQTAKEIKFDPLTFMLQAKGGIYLKFIREVEKC